MPGAIPLYQLAAALAEVIDDQFGSTQRYTAEIASIGSANARGHCYLELLDKDPRTGQEARIRAMIWANRWRVIGDQFLRETGQRLAKGMQILLEGVVTYHPQYGLGLDISYIDTAYTLGRQRQALERILAQLQLEGLMELQQALPVPPVLQRIAVISSPNAAGYQDFVHQLEGNPYGYAFSHTLFTAVMQGEETEASVLNALAAVGFRADEFDCVAVIRGGGADQDLVAFNTYGIGKSLAEFPLPVLTGIGHERDTTVPDLVAYARLKTPTAVAEYLVEQAATYEAALDDAAERIGRHLQTWQLQAQNQLARLENTLLRRASGYLPGQATRLTSLCERITAAAHRRLDKDRYAVEAMAQKAHLLDPRLQLRRGFALVYKDGRLLRSPAQAQGPLTLRLAEGEAQGTFTPQAG